jgi:hypothetical protein
MALRRWTPFTFLVPGRYVDEGPFWLDFDLDEWASSRYEWTQDPWNGFRDVAKRPRDTVRDETGDCEDFALVAAFWATANERTDVGLALCWDLPYPWPRHVVAYDADRVYSSGHITEQSVAEWVAESRYAFSLRRQIT